MGIPSNLINVLQQYEQYMIGKKDGGKEFENEKAELANRLGNIMSIGMGQYNKTQVAALRDFRDRFSKEYPKDRVVELISEMEENGFLTEKKQKLPKEMEAAVLAYKDIDTIDKQSKEMKQKIVAYAKAQIINATKEAPLNDSDLGKFTKIILHFWEEPYMKSSKYELIEKLISLLENANKGHQSKAGKIDFIRNATKLINAHNQEIFPKEVSHNPAYHGEEISEFLNKVFLHNAKELVEKYCEWELKPTTYLIRDSFIAPSRDNEGTEYYPVAVSYKTEGGQVEHLNITRLKTEDGKISWLHGKPPYESDKKENSFKTLKESIHQIKNLEGFKPKAQELGAHMKHSRALQDELQDRRRNRRKV